MRIKTEIIQSMFILTCEGPSLDASLALEFLTAMNSFIKKSQMDILLDLSSVNSIDSTGLGAIIRYLRDIGGHRQLILCGISERDLDLLKMTHLNNGFIQVTNRNKLLSNRFWEKKNKTHTPVSSRPEPPATKEESAIHHKRLTSDPEEDVKQKDPMEEEEPATLWEIDDADISEFIYGQEEAEEDLTVLYKTKDYPVEVITKKERRKYRRIEHKQIMDEEITIYCKNTVTGKHHMAVVLNISPGGLLLTSRSRLSFGDKLLLEGRLGRYFTFKEHAVFRSCHKENYGFEFVDLSMETTHFLNRLTGSVDMIKSNKFLCDQPN